MRRFNTLPLSIAFLACVGCSWFASPSTPTTAADIPATDPAANLPKCRPADAVETRGEVPFKEGATTPGGWKVAKVDASNFEFVNITYAKDGAEHILEVKYNDGKEQDWATTDYRLMPAKDQADPPEPLLTEVMDQLKAWQASQKAPFVKKTEGKVDPYDGLPPCGPNGEPI
jgi:hypothetical protein